MRVYLAGVLNRLRILKQHGIKSSKYNLTTYLEVRSKSSDLWEELVDFSSAVIVDSGAHSFQRGKKVDWDRFTDEYADWISRSDCDKVVGYFEMDIDNILGIDAVLKLRARLLQASSKIIPVWHKSYTYEGFESLCADKSFEFVSVSGFKNEDIKDGDFPLFVKTAHRQQKKIHGLGITRRAVLSAAKFDSVDSSTWLDVSRFGYINPFPSWKPSRFNGSAEDGVVLSFKHWLNWQKYWEAVTSGR